MEGETVEEATEDEVDGQPAHTKPEGGAVEDSKKAKDPKHTKKADTRPPKKNQQKHHHHRPATPVSPIKEMIAHQVHVTDEELAVKLEEIRDMVSEVGVLLWVGG